MAEPTRYVVDVDVHVVEFVHPVLQILRRHGHDELAAALLAGQSPEQRRRRPFAGTWWGTPTDDADEWAAAHVPAVLARRLADHGVDRAVLHTTWGQSLGMLGDLGSRVALARALNVYISELAEGSRDRLLPAAIVPTTDERAAVALIEEARDHEMRVINLELPRWGRTIADEPELVPPDAVLRSCLENEMVVMVHASAMGLTGRRTNSFLHNHLGAFAQGSEMVARALLLSGVMRRLPELKVCFCEGGPLWFIDLVAGLLSHLRFRGPTGLRRLDPSRLDTARAAEAVGGVAPSLVDGLRGWSEEGLLQGAGPMGGMDEFGPMGVTTEDQLLEQLSRLATTSSADPFELNLLRQLEESVGVQFPCMYASDFGHWDARPMADEAEARRQLADRSPEVASRLFVDDAAHFAGALAAEHVTTSVEDAPGGSRDPTHG